MLWRGERLRGPAHGVWLCGGARAHPPAGPDMGASARALGGASGRARACCAHLPAFRRWAGPAASERLIRKRRRRPRRQNRGAVVGGRSRDSTERLVTRKRKRVPVPASVSGPVPGLGSWVGARAARYEGASPFPGPWPQSGRPSPPCSRRPGPRPRRPQVYPPQPGVLSVQGLPVGMPFIHSAWHSGPPRNSLSREEPLPSA